LSIILKIPYIISYFPILGKTFHVALNKHFLFQIPDKIGTNPRLIDLAGYKFDNFYHFKDYQMKVTN